MNAAEIIGGQVNDTMAEIKQRIRDYCAAEGLLIPDEAKLESIVEPLRYQIAAMHTDALERTRGRH